ncbi:CLUMA_CG011895, isoform A [Clunio marinus]|uniref:CLUMA_CG011895, isoform A n=1 Tax=Clunio marinus TaxID=568069 RepID=A0A1J1IEA6_9DIPT|nr:CLUMA_CG011895, isoform A [Clunio marinus]
MFVIFLATWLKACKRNDPNENNCFKEMFGGIFPHIANGIPDLGIEPFEPLGIRKISVSRNTGQVVQLNGSFNNLKIRGPSNATVAKAELNLEKKFLNFDLEIPKLRINATYNLKGNILLLPLIGAGDVNILLKEIKTSVFTKISLRKIPQEVINIDQMKVKFNVGNMRIHLDNLFNGNKVLSASFSMFLNQNSKEILAELQEDLENGLGDIFTGIWNSVYNKMPIDLWLL